VLVAEDNMVNQTLLMKMLERHGHSVRVVANGADLVDRLWESPDAYDVALVDIQMPVMDGYEATTVIRLREEQFERKRIPIVAVTAHTMGGERERCIEAGMDGYLSKPVSDKELTAILESVLAERQLAPSSVDADDDAAAGGARAGEPFDREHVLDIAAGDMEFLSGLVDIFADTAPTLVDEIARHIADGQSDGVYRKAHQLKGSISNFRAVRARSVAARIEELGVNSDLDAAAALMGELRSRLDELVSALQALAREMVN
jgi:CheY-like chemotaxis protein